MMNRRRALSAIGLAAAFRELWSPTSLTVIAAELPKTADDHLRAELTFIGSRVYSEEGVPMFLACEDLSGIGVSPAKTPTPSALNQKIASAFSRYAGEWQRMRPDAPSSDVAKILELIADHDFAAGGTEVSL